MLTRLFYNVLLEIISKDKHYIPQSSEMFVEKLLLASNFLINNKQSIVIK